MAAWRSGREELAQERSAAWGKWSRGAMRWRPMKGMAARARLQMLCQMLCQMMEGIGEVEVAADWSVQATQQCNGLLSVSNSAA